MSGWQRRRTALLQTDRHRLGEEELYLRIRVGFRRSSGHRIIRIFRHHPDSRRKRTASARNDAAGSELADGSREIDPADRIDFHRALRAGAERIGRWSTG